MSESLRGSETATVAATQAARDHVPVARIVASVAASLVVAIERAFLELTSRARADACQKELPSTPVFA